MSKMKIKKTAPSILLGYLAVCLPVFGAEVNLPVTKDLSSHGVTQAQLNGLDAIMLRAIEKGTVTGCIAEFKDIRIKHLTANAEPSKYKSAPP